MIGLVPDTLKICILMEYQRNSQRQIQHSCLKQTLMPNSLITPQKRPLQKRTKFGRRKFSERRKKIAARRRKRKMKRKKRKNLLKNPMRLLIKILCNSMFKTQTHTILTLQMLIELCKDIRTKMRRKNSLKRL